MKEGAVTMMPQLAVMLDEGGLAGALDGAFGDGAFEAWVARMRDGGFMPQAWSDEEEPPPVFFLLSEELEERLMTDEEREAMERVKLDEDGVVRGKEFAVKVMAVETGFDDRPVRLDAWLTMVPDTRAPSRERRGHHCEG